MSSSALPYPAFAWLALSPQRSTILRIYFPSGVCYLTGCNTLGACSCQGIPPCRRNKLRRHCRCGSGHGMEEQVKASLVTRTNGDRVQRRTRMTSSSHTTMIHDSFVDASSHLFYSAHPFLFYFSCSCSPFSSFLFSLSLSILTTTCYSG